VLSVDDTAWPYQIQSQTRDDAVTRVIIAIPVLLVGGTEIQTTALVKALVGVQNKVTVCCYFEFDPSMVDTLRDAGAEVHLLKRRRTESRLRLFLALLHYFRRHRPDVVHVQHLAPAFVPMLAARAALVPTVCASVHQPGRTYSCRARLLMKLASRLCDTIFCVSRAVERSWFGDSLLYSPDRSARDRRHWTIYDALDLDWIAGTMAGSSADELKVAMGLQNRAVVGCIGRLRWEKGQGTVVDALAALLKEDPLLMLVIIGDGPDRAKLERRAADLGVSKNVLWLGSLTHEDVLRHYAVMDVVVVPSVFEGFGLTAAEAMAAGRAIVATAVDGLREVVVDSDSGILVPPNDPPAIVKAIEVLLRDDDLRNRLASRARDRARDFSYERFRSLTVAAHSSLLNPRVRR
jgi:glycosyltransferase involved in cell wall biosynthesis